MSYTQLIERIVESAATRYKLGRKSPSEPGKVPEPVSVPTT
jgi:hypothetical protein